LVVDRVNIHPQNWHFGWSCKQSASTINHNNLNIVVEETQGNVSIAGNDTINAGANFL
jgi:hypothetical protein